MTPIPGRTVSNLDSSWVFENEEESWSTSSDDNSSNDGVTGSLIADLPPNSDDDEDDSQTPPSELAEKIRGILAHITEAGLTLGSFLHAVSWGDAGCVRDPKIRAARTALMNSPELPVILKNWWMPPRSSASRKSRSQGAHSVLEEFAVECIQGALDSELDALCNQFRTPDDIQEDFFTGTHFALLAKQCKTAAPILWGLLSASVSKKSRVDQNSKKAPSKVILFHLFTFRD